MKTEVPGSFSDDMMERRSFLRYAGAGVASAGLLAVASCHKDHPININHGVDIGTGDTAILNYAYALEQLEAAFYIQVVLTPYTDITPAETTFLTDIRDHEVCHREFLKASLAGSAITTLTFDFSKIDFTSRTAVLGAAKTFEDTGVQAYDGAAYLIQDRNLLGIAAKIVSVEARHAALIRNLINFGDFGGPDMVSATTGLNSTLTIAQVLTVANAYMKTKVSAQNYNYIA